MNESILNDLLECPICLERLDKNKVLPCQHTFCKKCLEDLVAKRKELRCPECRVPVPGKVEDLPSNVFVMRILEGIKNTEAKKQQQRKRNLVIATPQRKPKPIAPRAPPREQREVKKNIQRKTVLFLID